MIINPSGHKYTDVYKLLIGSIVPRPIGFISTVDVNGHRNLAPFSFFNASDLVKCPRVKESLVTMECKLVNIIHFGQGPGSGNAVFGEGKTI